MKLIELSKFAEIAPNHLCRLVNPPPGAESDEPQHRPRLKNAQRLEALTLIPAERWMFAPASELKAAVRDLDVFDVHRRWEVEPGAK